MSYSRQQMIEAYLNGVQSAHPLNQQNPRNPTQDAARYVDSLQNQSEQVKNTARTDEPIQISQEDYRYGLEQFGGILSAKTLKLSDQNIAVAKILGGFIFRASTMHFINERTGMALHQDFLEDAIRQLREAFPELDTES